MRTSYIIIGTVIAFLILSTFGGIQSCKVKRYAVKVAELELTVKLQHKEKETLKVNNAELKVGNSVISGEKKALEIKLSQYKAEAEKQISAFKTTIRELNSMPADTVYQNIFSKWSAFDQVLKFRFAENQIRGIYLNILERDHFENLYSKTNKSLLTCANLNIKNDQLILNLDDQNTNLQAQVDISDLQIGNLQDNLDLTKKQIKKDNTKLWLLKGAAVVGASGWLAFILK